MGDFFKSDEQNVTAKTAPWKPAKPYLKDIMGEASNIYHGDRPEYYPGDAVADFDPYQTQALDLTAARALEGSPLVDQAGGFYKDLLTGEYMGTPGGDYQTGALDTWNPALGYAEADIAAAAGALPGTDYYDMLMSGDMLNANPWVDEMYASASRPIMDQWTDLVAPAVAGQFALGGRYGSNAHQDALQRSTATLGRTLSDLSANIYGNNYARERGFQHAAAGALNADEMARRGLGLSATGQYGNLAATDLSRQLGASGMLDSSYFGNMANRLAAGQGSLGIANQDYVDLAQLMQAGTFNQLQAQNEIDAEKAKWDFGQIGAGSDLAALEAYMNFITGAGSGGGSTSQNVYGPSNFENWANIINSGVSVMGT